MLVPRSYTYSSSTRDSVQEKKHGSGIPRQSIVRPPQPSRSQRTQSSLPLPSPPSTPARCAGGPVSTPTRPVAVPTAAPSVPHLRAAASANMPVSASRKLVARKSHHTGAHDPSALPPAVAALLAMTTIPRPKKEQFRRQRPESRRRISSHELISEWKGDDTLNAGLSCSPVLNVLLEEAIAAEEAAGDDVADDDDFLQCRSASADSMPSLEADERSLLSTGSLATPNSLRSRRSIGTLRRDKRIPSSPTAETCHLDHPLLEAALQDVEPDDDFAHSPANAASFVAPKPRSTFKSNLTASLQAIKNKAISSISSLSSAAPAGGSGQTSTKRRISATRPAPMLFSDDLLWSHPFLFPRLSSEVRPAINGTPTEAQRRYFNPPPLNFDEQEAPYQQALHGPYLAEARRDAHLPSIPMQTYYPRGCPSSGSGTSSTGRRRSSSSKSDLTSEAGRALSGTSGMRLREPRENPDFLRVVVLEMNMRREGKLEAGRARIWLPPRLPVVLTDDMDECERPDSQRRVPSRWVGVSADD